MTAPNVYEDEGSYVVDLDVAEFTEGELSVEVAGRDVTVRGTQAEAPGSDAFRVRERLEEAFRLPGDADLHRATASYAHGRLQIRAPRIDTAPRMLPIERPARQLVNPHAEPC